MPSTMEKGAANQSEMEQKRSEKQDAGTIVVFGLLACVIVLADIPVSVFKHLYEAIPCRRRRPQEGFFARTKNVINEDIGIFRDQVKEIRHNLPKMVKR